MHTKVNAFERTKTRYAPVESIKMSKLIGRNPFIYINFDRKLASIPFCELTKSKIKRFHFTIVILD